jgi:ABC-2 type transport system ATP-binding protein
VSVLGLDPRKGGAALRSRIGYLPGELRLEERYTGRELLDFYAGSAGPATRTHAAELAERLGLDTSRRIRQLSKGNKQKLGLVQAFMHRPDLLVLDEPSSGLDPLVQQEFLQLLREARDRGQTVFLSSHVLSEIQQVAVRVGILRQGRLVRLASVTELRATAPRRLRITFGAAQATAALAALTQLPGLLGVTREAAATADQVVVLARLQGSPAALLQLLAGYAVQDIVIAEPDLEEAVLELYGQEPGQAGLQPGPGA